MILKKLFSKRKHKNKRNVNNNTEKFNMMAAAYIDTGLYYYNEILKKYPKN